MNKIITVLATFSIFFLFFEGFIFKVGSNSYLFYYIFIILSLFFVYFSLHSKRFFLKLKFLYFKTPFKYLIYFLAWLIIDSIILLITNKVTLLIFYYLISKLFLTAIICYFISSIFIPNYISIKTSIKLLFIFMMIFIITGFLGYLGDSYNITFLKAFVNFFSNLKETLQGSEIMLDTISGTARARSIFHEPGSFGKYILLFSPIMYKICLSKYKIFNNNFLNIVFKYSLIPLSIICIILTKSPIMLIFFAAFLICYFYKNIILLLKKYFLIIFCGLISIIIGLQFLYIDLSNSYLYRIIITLSNIRSFENLVFLEPSLATRIVSYVNSFRLFLDKPFLGYGFDNARFYLAKYFLTSPLLLTQENKAMLQLALTTQQGMGINYSLITRLLSETGIFGTFLYFLFLYKHIKYIDKLKSHFQGIERKFLEGLKISILIVICLSFYIYSFATSYLYLYYGFICSYVTQYYINKRRISKQ